MNGDSFFGRRFAAFVIWVVCFCLLAPGVVFAKGPKVDPKTYLTGQVVGALVWVKRSDGKVLRGQLDSVGADTFTMRAKGTLAFSKPTVEVVAYADVVEAKDWDPGAIGRRYFKVMLVAAIVVSIPLVILMVKLFTSGSKVVLAP